MNLAIVTACPNGMVTSVLCARLLDAAAQRQGWSTSVEVVDVQHPERQLSQATLDAAEWVLLVSSTPVDMQRFVGKRVFQSTPAQALADVEAVLRRGRRSLSRHSKRCSINSRGLPQGTMRWWLPAACRAASARCGSKAYWNN